MADTMSIEKEDLSKDHSGDESTGSSPEAEVQQNGNSANAPQENQQPKRKGGRKPVCISHTQPCLSFAETSPDHRTVRAPASSSDIVAPAGQFANKVTCH
jgi:hypothetical protein